MLITRRHFLSFARFIPQPAPIPPTPPVVLKPVILPGDYLQYIFKFPTRQAAMADAVLAPYFSIPSIGLFDNIQICDNNSPLGAFPQPQYWCMLILPEPEVKALFTHPNLKLCFDIFAQARNQLYVLFVAPDVSSNVSILITPYNQLGWTSQAKPPPIIPPVPPIPLPPKPKPPQILAVSRFYPVTRRSVFQYRGGH